MIILNVLALCAFALCCYGWGSIVHVFCYPGRKGSPAFVVALGLVALTLLGGILNLSRLAFGVSLAICAYSGILLAILSIAWFGIKLPGWTYLVILSALGILLAATLLPASVFNFHDDFLTYMPRITRLRQIGTLGGNPFEPLGATDFGLQSFFQALITTWLPIESAFAFDTIFCFLLGLYLLVEIGRGYKCPVIGIALAMFGLRIDRSTNRKHIVGLFNHRVGAGALALHVATKLLRLRMGVPVDILGMRQR